MCVLRVGGGASNLYVGASEVRRVLEARRGAAGAFGSDFGGEASSGRGAKKRLCRTSRVCTVSRGLRRRTAGDSDCEREATSDGVSRDGAVVAIVSVFDTPLLPRLIFFPIHFWSPIAYPRTHTYLKRRLGCKSEKAKQIFWLHLNQDDDLNSAGKMVACYVVPYPKPPNFAVDNGLLTLFSGVNEALHGDCTDSDYWDCNES
ncbi:auxin efflux carrier family protein [Striga asiatica]|uniref:Auxin efflux carrier family protein n=1 Tax=Striga asiatica TaxID=4170 RepID=A0A5A7PDY2_STRAF|nr:auxin efflux carrier family protein [Striga asiatica]